MGENIQTLIDLLQEDIMRGAANLSGISGLEIACGNPDHLLELLQVIHQLTVMMAESPTNSSPGTSGANHPDMSSQQ